MIVCSIDPAFKKCAFVVIDSANFKILMADNVNLLDGYVKSNQTEYIKKLWKEIKQRIAAIQQAHTPDVWVIENQIGKFACVQVHSMLISAISDVNDNVISQSPKFKLADDLGLQGYVDSDSNRYNQNKNKGKAICQHFLNSSHQQHVSLDRDIADAILQAVYYIQHKIGTKLDYSTFQQVVQESQPSEPVKVPKKRQPRKKAVVAE